MRGKETERTFKAGAQKSNAGLQGLPLATKPPPLDGNAELAPPVPSRLDITACRDIDYSNSLR